MTITRAERMGFGKENEEQKEILRQELADREKAESEKKKEDNE